MGLSHATAMVVGTILGASIFVQPSEISRHVPSVPGMMLVWLLAGILTFCGALVCAELASAFPQTGGVYVFLQRIYSPAIGFLWGWAMFWSVHSGIIAAMGVIFARYVGYFAPLDENGIRAVAILGIWVLSAINYAGVRPGSAVQLVLTVAKLLAIGLILAVFVALGPSAPKPLTLAEAGGAGRVSWPGFAFALTAALFTFGGWHMVTYTAGETRDPERTIPRALLIGTLTVTACYLSLNAAYLYILPLDKVMTSTRVAADAAQLVLGTGAGAAISALVILSAFGALNGIILAGPRVYFVMAQDKLAFPWMGAIHSRHQTPHRAILLQAVWSSVLVATNTYRELFTRVIYTEWLFFVLLAVGIFLLRRRPGYGPPFLTSGYPIAPVLFIVSSAVIVFNQLRANLVESATGLFLVVLGLPVYYFWSRRNAQEGAVHARH